VHLKIDTGMGRLGVWHEHTAPLYEKIVASPHVALAGVFTHFASPDDDPAFTQEQRRRFLAALATCKGIDLQTLFVHADNSAGLETMSGAFPFNAVRIGLLQFGVLPHARSLLSNVRTEPVFSFHTRIGIVKTLPAGTTISYGRTHTLDRETRVAVLCAGYGDGIPRAASNRAQVLVHGVRCPVLGRITMDQTVIDVSAVPSAATGDAVVLVGRQGDQEITVSEFSRWADTIPWETLCAVTKRVTRIYKTPLGV